MQFLTLPFLVEWSSKKLIFFFIFPTFLHKSDSFNTNSVHILGKFFFVLNSFPQPISSASKFFCKVVLVILNTYNFYHSIKQSYLELSINFFHLVLFLLYLQFKCNCIKFYHIKEYRTMWPFFDWLIIVYFLCKLWLT